jgi:hypothetical protein
MGIQKEHGSSHFSCRAFLQGEVEHMRSMTMAALEDQLKCYEDELMRLRIENEQLRQSSQAFGELAERLSVALRTATRVNRRAMAADSGRRRSVLES